MWSKLPPVVGLVCVVGACAWLFGATLTGHEVFAFRDVVHFYRPMWEFAGRGWPLWNPRENLGTPFVADASSSLFYPLKLVRCGPWPAHVAQAWYLAVHVVLAGAAMYAAARLLSIGRWGAALAGVAYALSGQVLFQHTNEVFLVGSAWLPLAVALGMRLAGGGEVVIAVAWAMVLALLVLGGDPQAAYVAVLVTAAYVPLARKPGRGRALPVVVAAVVFTGLLAAAQIVPTWELYRSSARAADVGAHRSAVYEFTVEPWRLVELVWPNVGGRMFPEHHRWWAALPGAQRVWTPSLYLGVVPLMLAVVAIGRRVPEGGRFLAAMSVVALLAAWGPWGGVYWVFEQVLPGFDAFRYPGKMFTLASSGVCLLAGAGLESVARDGPGRLVRWMVAMAAVSLALVALSWPLAGVFQSAVAGQADILLGPLDTQGALEDLRLALLHTAAVLAVAAALLPLRTGGAALVVLTALELVGAHSWFVATVPRDAAPGSTLAERIAATTTPGEPAPRFWRPPRWLPDEWSKSRSPRRLKEAWQWDQQTGFPRYPLPLACAAVEAPQSIPLADYEAFVKAAADISRPQLAARRITVGTGLDALGVEWYIGPPATESAPPDVAGEFVPLVAETLETPAVGTPVLLRRSSAAPRAWIVHRWEQVPGPADYSQAALDAATTQALKEGGRARNLFAEATVEGPIAPVAAAGPPRHDESCRIVACEPRQIDVEATLIESGLVVLAEQYYPGWNLTVDGRPHEILRVNRVMRGAFLPAGEHRLSFRYEPRSIIAGAVVSLFAWIGVLAWLVWKLARARKNAGA